MTAGSRGRTSRLASRACALLSFAAAGCAGTGAPAQGQPDASQPPALFLTWQRDPTSTMTIDWHDTTGVADVRLHVRRAAVPDGNWTTLPAESFPFPHSNRTVHRVELTGLDADASYEFRVDGYARLHRFRTLPRTLDRPVRFAVGGDTRHRQDWMERTGRRAAAWDPDFVVFGGDLAYADGNPRHVRRWYEWFEAVRNSLVTPDGRSIPVLVAVGNHEVRGGYVERVRGYRQDDATRARIAPFFFALFAMPGQPGWAALDAGDYLSLILLDSGHANPIDGEQTDWLAAALAARDTVPHVFPVYHIPAFPSARDYDNARSRRIREHWVPLFERHGIAVAFENHDHTYKRTHPVRSGSITADGIVYFGDGAWGIRTRRVRRARGGDPPWYIARAASVRHFVLAEIDAAGRRFVAVDETGRVFDELPAGSAARMRASPDAASAGGPTRGPALYTVPGDR
jgi:hypothetical protein